MTRTRRVLYFFARPKLWQTLLFFAGVIAFVMWAMAYGYQQSNRDDQLKLGVSYSYLYAEEIGIEPQRGLLALMDDIGIKHFRLMSYWDRIEAEKGEYDWSELDWQMDQAARHEATVTLAVGQRQPRFPECHVPEWVEELNTEERQIQILGFLEQVVIRYGDHPALASYQVENEAANALFGECPPFDRGFLTQEIELIRGLDPDTPVHTNASNQSGTPLGGPIGDEVGFSIYKRAHFEALGNQWPFSYWFVPSWWHSFRASLVEGFTDAEHTFVHELQAEPWGPVPTVGLTLEEQNKTMDPDKLLEIVAFTEQTGMKEMYLWGGEWWYWRLTEFGDKELWQTVRNLYDRNEVY